MQTIKDIIKSIFASALLTALIFFCFWCINKIFTYIRPETLYTQKELYFVLALTLISTFFIFLGKYINDTLIDITRIILLIVTVVVGIIGVISFLENGHTCPFKELFIVILNIGLMQLR